MMMIILTAVVVNVIVSDTFLLLGEEERQKVRVRRGKVHQVRVSLESFGQKSFE